MPAETRRTVRRVGTTLAAASLALAGVSATQSLIQGPQGAEDGGVMAWVCALFVGVSILALFLVVLSLARPPPRSPGARLPGAAREG